MEIPLGTSLLIVAVAIVALLVVLSAFAGLLYWLTGMIKGEEEQEEEAAPAPATPQAAGGADAERASRVKVALAAVALARAAQARKRAALEPEGFSSPWYQFHLNRRLNQTIRLRRNS